MPPRSLKAPMGVWFSCFTTISTPVSALSKGQAYCGVGGTIARTSGITLSSSASVNIRLYVSLQLTNDLTLALNALLFLSDIAERPNLPERSVSNPSRHLHARNAVPGEMAPNERIAHQLVGVRIHVAAIGAADIHIEFGHLLHDIAGMVHCQASITRMDLSVVLPGYPQDERAQRLVHHVHPVHLQPHMLLREQSLTPLSRCFDVAQRALTGIVADAERVGAEFEVTE